MSRVLAIAIVVFASVLSHTAHADTASRRIQNAFTIYGGVSTPSRFLTGVCCFALGRFEEDYLVGIGYNRHLATLGNGFSLEGEVGYARRFGMSRTNEVWAAGLVRWQGFPWDSVVRTTVGLAVGVSYADPVPAIERTRATEGRTDISRVFAFLGPEITLSLPSTPNVELVLRVHHRSGWYKIGGVTLLTSNSASNVMTAGLRFGF